MRFKYLLLAAFAICLNINTKAQLQTKELDNKLEQFKKALGNDAAALIYKDGKIVYKKKLSDNFDEKTQTQIGGSSRWLTTALILQLVDEGKLNLDAKISDYLPIYATYGKKYITIRHCLTDLTGIESKKSIEDAGKFESLELLVNDYAKKEIRANAGTDFWYGGIGINIAARVAELVTKKGFEQLIMQRIIRPLGMKGTTFSPENNRCVNPAGGALSTASDYINFLSMLLNNGMFNGKPILSAASVEELKKIQVPANMIVYAPKGSENFGFALGGCVMDKTAEDKATVIGCPNFAGIWPYIDLCRGYACIIFPKDYKADAKKDIYTAFKDAIDAQLTSSCK